MSRLSLRAEVEKNNRRRKKPLRQRKRGDRGRHPGGHVTVAAGNPVAFRPYEEAGELKCPAQFGHKRDMNFVPNVLPTFKEQGNDVVVDLWRWIVVPKGAPPDRVKFLAASFKNILHDKETVASMGKIGC